MPGFCRDCRCDVAEAGSRCPACGSPRLLHHPELERARGRACGLRRLLRHHREARRPHARRQAGDRGRPPARGGAHRLLRGAHLRGALRDAHVRGEAAVSVGDRGAAGHGEIRARRRAGARPHARPHAVGRAGLDRRSLHGSVRHRAPARHLAREVAGGLRRPGRARDRHHGVDRALLQQVPGQDRLRSRQAARLCGPRRRRSRRVPGRQAGHPDFRGRQGRAGPAGAATASAPSATCSAPAQPI